jgi:hypothetical protein
MHRSRWIVLSFMVFLLCACGKDPGVPEKVLPASPDLIQREVDACVENARQDAENSVAGNLTLVIAEFNLHPSLHSECDSIMKMGAAWDLQGYALSEVEVRRILNSLSNAIDPFQSSTREFISALSLDPVSQMDTVDFADSLDLDYKTKARLAKQLAETLEQAEWLKEVFDQVLQRKVTGTELDSAIERFTKCQSDQTLCRR